MGNIPDMESGSTRVGIVVFGRSASIIVHLDDFTNKTSLLSLIDGITYKPKQQRNTAAGIETMINDFNEHSRDRIDKIAVIITTGAATMNSGSTIRNAEEAKDQSSVTIYAIGITNNVDEDELKGMSSDPQKRDNNYFIFTGYEDLVESTNSLYELVFLIGTVEPPGSEQLSKYINLMVI